MLTSPPPDLLGQALAQSTTGALLTLVAVGACAWTLWALSCWMGRRRQEHLRANRLAARYSAHDPTYLAVVSERSEGFGHRASGRQTLTQLPPHTAMKPLELDLARIETLPAIQTVAPPPAASPRQTPHLPPAASSATSSAASSAVPLAAPHTRPHAEGAPGAGGSADGSADGNADNWPPAAPPGATIYRYIFASGQLFRLSDLRPHRTFPVPRDTWN